MSAKPSAETTDALKEWILLRYVMAVYERDKKAIAASHVKFPNAYLELIDKAQHQAHADLVKCKRLFTSDGLKVLDEVETKIDLKIMYIYRGYQDQAVYIMGHLAAETELRVRKYLGIEKDPGTA